MKPVTVSYLDSYIHREKQTYILRQIHKVIKNKIIIQIQKYKFIFELKLQDVNQYPDCDTWYDEEVSGTLLSVSSIFQLFGNQYLKVS